MPQQLLSNSPAALNQTDSLLEQTRQLFGQPSSNAELMAQIMSAIRALHPLCEQPKA